MDRIQNRLDFLTAAALVLAFCLVCALSAIASIDNRNKAAIHRMNVEENARSAAITGR